MIVSQESVNLKINIFIISALISGFLLVPIHELGHVICHWISGNPAGMSYARDYMLSDGKFTLLGVSGGLFFPVIISVVFLFIIFLRPNCIAILIPFIILGSIERAIQYLFGITPSDEKIVSDFLLLNVNYIKLIFLIIPIIINSLLIALLFRNKFKLLKIIFVYVIVVIAFIIMASFGIYIVEKNLFPVQYNIQFG